MARYEKDQKVRIATNESNHRYPIGTVVVVRIVGGTNYQTGTTDYIVSHLCGRERDLVTNKELLPF